MENNLADRSHERNDVTGLLNDLESDRAGLAQRLREPRWFAPALGAIAAFYISTPALPEAFDRGYVLTSLIITSILLALAYQRVTGIKLLRFRVREGALFAMAIVVTLFFFSVSLGLAAGEVPWWIIASAVVGFLSVTGLTLLGAASMRERVRNVS